MKIKLFNLVLALFISNWAFNQQFGSDVIVKNEPSKNQALPKIASAFNGWLFEIHSNEPGNVTIQKSTNGGLTWVELLNFTESLNDYIDLDIEVSGNNEANIRVSTIELTYNNSDMNYSLDFWQYNVDGDVLNAYAMSTGTEVIYSADLSSNAYDEFITGPNFNLGCVFAKSGPFADSILYTASFDGGAFWDEQEIVNFSSLYYRNVSLAIGENQTDPRHAFVSYDQFDSPSDDYGNVYYTKKDAFGFSWLTPEEINPEVNNVKNPIISATSDLNELGTTDVCVAYELDYNGDGSDLDVVCRFQLDATAGTNTWQNGAVSNGSGSQEVSPNLFYEGGTFGAVVSNMSDGSVNVFAIDFNNPFVPDFLGMVNDVSAGNNSQPAIARNDFENSFDVIWVNSSGANGVVMYDGFYENNSGLESMDFEAIEFSGFPNPTKDILNVEWKTETNEAYSFTIVDALGKIMYEKTSTSVLGKNSFQIDIKEYPQGLYTLIMVVGEKNSYKKISKI